VSGVRIAVFALAALLCAPAYAERHTVTLDGFAFKPATLQVKAGDEIEWVNKDIVEHTATARDGAFDSKILKPGASWRWKATRPGNHVYFCTLHPTMTATLEVK
jgi:plastocyanin